MSGLTKEWVEKEIAWMLKHSPESESYIALCRHWLATQWQPIETAPKDGAPILLFQPGHTVKCLDGSEFKTHSEITLCEWWSDQSDGDFWRIIGGKQEYALNLRGDSPTHWQPLPEPPQ